MIIMDTGTKKLDMLAQCITILMMTMTISTRISPLTIGWNKVPLLKRLLWECLYMDKPLLWTVIKMLVSMLQPVRKEKLENSPRQLDFWHIMKFVIKLKIRDGMLSKMLRVEWDRMLTKTIIGLDT